MTDQFVDLLATASFTLGVFGTALCLLQTRDVWPFRALALVLIASCATTLDAVPWPPMAPDTALQFEIITTVLWLIALLAIAPLFWHYVCAITAVTPRLPHRICVHAFLPFVALILGLSVPFMPQEARLGLFTDTLPLPSGWPYAVGVAGEILLLAAIAQWGVYMVAIVRRLLRYRTRLKKYVASTEQRELRWVWVIIVAFSAYWVISAIDEIADLMSEHALIPDWLDGLFGLGLLSIVLLNGLRQKPSLAPDVVAPENDTTKYERSALTPEMATRIERKLHAAMITDLLHRDPNLSLWTLARHIGASPNYISQTLNENIGDSFFDFVNSYRIGDAQMLLRETDHTVLTITYDVGFNSRSSFYTAFKKVTGQTPTGYRQEMSGPP